MAPSIIRIRFIWPSTFTYTRSFSLGVNGFHTHSRCILYTVSTIIVSIIYCSEMLLIMWVGQGQLAQLFMRAMTWEEAIL